MIEVNFDTQRSRRDRRPQAFLDRSPERAPSTDNLTRIANTLALAMMASSVLAISHFLGLL
jgi:hypothetical protein